MKEKNQINRSSLYLLVLSFVFFNLIVTVESQNVSIKLESKNQKELKIKINKEEKDSTTVISVIITNNSAKGYYISIGETERIQQKNDRKVFFYTTYSHISDPLLIPKLEMPFYLLKQDSVVTFRKEYRSINVFEVEVYLDIFESEFYPYKKHIKTQKRRRRMKNKRTYHYLMDFSGDTEKLNSIYLIDYYEMREEQGEIRSYYEKIILESEKD